MGLKKFKNLFSKSSGEEKKPHLSAASTSKEPPMEVERQRPSKEENQKAKLEVEQLQKLITNKLKDPAMAKKAASILEEMLNSTGKK